MRTYVLMRQLTDLQLISKENMENIMADKIKDVIETAKQSSQDLVKTAAIESRTRLMEAAAKAGGKGTKMNELVENANASINMPVAETDGKKIPKYKQEGRQSPKAKSELGLSEDTKITWVPVGLTPEENKTLQNVARFRNKKVANMLGEMLKTYLATDDIKKSIDEDNDAYELEQASKQPSSVRANKFETMTEEQLIAEQKKIEAQQKKMQAMIDKLNQFKSKA